MPASLERGRDDGQQVLLVGARGQLGHHAAVLLVYFLGGHHVAQQLAAGQHGRAGVVAGRFNGKDNGMSEA